MASSPQPVPISSTPACPAPHPGQVEQPVDLAALGVGEVAQLARHLSNSAAE